MERSLTEVREAHWRTLAMAATLEEEIEWLSHPISRGQLEAQAHSRSQVCCKQRSRGQKRRLHQVWLEDCHAPYFEYHPPLRGLESKEDEEPPMDFNEEAPLEIGLEVNCFLQGPAKSLEEEDRKTSSPEPPVEELESWVSWTAQMHEMPGWWQELAKVPGVDDHNKLTSEVWASFQLLQRTSEWHQVENYHQAPLATLCLHQKSFLPLPNSKFPYQEIRELQWEKTVAYTKALQFWVEKANTPTEGQPQLLVGSAVELREEMKCYISFTDEDIFSGIALPEESPITQTKEGTPKGAQPAKADFPVKEATMDVTMEPTREKKPLNWFPGWEKLLHPSWPVVAAGQIPPY